MAVGGVCGSYASSLWRTVKYEEVYLHDYQLPKQAHRRLAAYFDFYNYRRPHQALDGRTPMTVWRTGMTGLLPANAVDMTLQPPAWSLDDASASPTCPPRQPQQAFDAA